MVQKAFGGGKRPPRFLRRSRHLDKLESICGLRSIVAPEEEEEDSCCCRICFEPGTLPEPGAGSSDKQHLVRPCACMGSMSYVHPACLARWRHLCSGAAKNRCGVCLQPYSYPLSPISRWQQLVCLLPTILSMLCICLVICSAYSLPVWPRALAGSIALVVLARNQTATSLMLILLASFMAGLYLRGIQLVAEADSCSKVCLAWPRPSLPQSKLLGAAFGKLQQHRQGQEQKRQQQQEQKERQQQQLEEWQWPDSLFFEESLFREAEAGADSGADDSGEAVPLEADGAQESGGHSSSAAACSCASTTARHSTEDSRAEDARGRASGTLLMWPKLVLMRLGWP